MPLIARVMGEASTEFVELDRIVVTTGPGSFTGLRVGISAARGIALASGKPAIGVTTLAAYAAPYIAQDDTIAVTVAIDARHEHVYLQVFGAGGRTLVAPRIVSLRDAARASATRSGAADRHRPPSWSPPMAARPNCRRALVEAASGAGYRLGGAARGRRQQPPAPRTEAALSAGTRRAAAGRREAAAPMMEMVTRLFTRGEPALSEASLRDAAALAGLHAASFHRGWSDGEFERLLAERNTIAHRAMIGRTTAGFIMSRLVEGEAEILSVAVAPARRGKGLARRLLTLHLRPPRRAARRNGVSRGRRGPRAGPAALPACRLQGGRPPTRLLHAGPRPSRDGAGAAPRSGVTRRDRRGITRLL